VDLMPTYHPAFLLRNPAKKREVWEDLQQVMTRLGLTSPR
jgi:DNA polymerase